MKGGLMQGRKQGKGSQRNSESGQKNWLPQKAQNHETRGISGVNTRPIRKITPGFRE
jgi:hypothetical protein